MAASCGVGTPESNCYEAGCICGAIYCQGRHPTLLERRKLYYLKARDENYAFVLELFKLSYILVQYSYNTKELACIERSVYTILGLD